MNLLLADDEKLTREGLFQGVPWQQLGIRTCLTAVDGLSALELAESFRPDILLTDVRMPRLDGIGLARQLQERFPDMGIIFMSGYSDKEYLKAAIRLKAVSYIEKPIRLDEVEQVVRAAVADVRQRRQDRRLRSLSLQQDYSDTALALIQPEADREGAGQESPGLRLPIPEQDVRACATALVRLYGQPDEEQRRNVCGVFANLAEAMHFSEIHAARQPSLLVFHLLCTGMPSPGQYTYFCCRLQEALCTLPLSFHIVMGKEVPRPRQIYESYQSAIICLQRIFFQRENTTLIYQHGKTGHGIIAATATVYKEGTFRRLLLGKDEEQVRIFLEKILSRIIVSNHLMPGQVREIYYQLSSELRQAAAALHVDLPENSGEQTVWDRISTGPTVYALHRILLGQSDAFFDMLRKTASVSSPVFLIQSYISSHLSDRNLSIKAISDDVRLSSSYICTIFKAETGSTLTQYITERRMEEAKRLLLDPRARVADVSEAVGFSDSNYFSKAFKKTYGLSPTEFRDSL